MPQKRAAKRPAVRRVGRLVYFLIHKAGSFPSLQQGWSLQLVPIWRRGGPATTALTVLGTPLGSAPSFLPTLAPSFLSPATQALLFGLREVAIHRALMLPRRCWGEQTASQPVKLYFLATCLKLQLPDMANEFYNQKLKWISCSRCFYSGNYQTFLAAHLSFKRIKLCTSIMCCHWSIAQLYQTFYSGNWINFLQGVFCVAL